MAVLREKKNVLALALVVGFVLLVYAGTQLYWKSGPTPGECAITDADCPHEEQLNQLVHVLPLLVGLGILVGAGTYFLMSEKLESTQASLKKNTGLLLKFLNKDEKKIVDRLLKEEGRVLQSDLSRIEGLGKVKAHRILQRLVDRGVIEVEEHGKTNIVRFTKEVKDGLF